MKKTIFLLNIDNFAPEVTKITYPLIYYYADRIGATVHLITERKFPTMPVTYEKLQIYALAQEQDNAWNIYVDSDTLIHPECPDFSLYLPSDTVAFHALDYSPMRFRPDEISLNDLQRWDWRKPFAQRVPRFLAPGNWFAIASRKCVNLWKPLDIPLQEALSNIFVSPQEFQAGITKDHLIDDYTLGRNLARYHLKVKSFRQIYEEQKFWPGFLQHQYLMPQSERVAYLTGAIYNDGPATKPETYGWSSENRGVSKLYEQIVKDYPWPTQNNPTLRLLSAR
jgi:hypothetical protein